MNVRLSLALVVGVSSVACGGGGGDPLDSADQIAGWANASSALGVFVHGYEPLALADGAMAPADADCPTITDDDTTLTIAGGGCEDSEGVTWLGTATVVRASAGDKSLTLAEFDRAPDPSFAEPFTGTVEVAELEPDLHSFDVDIARTSGVETEIVYSGTVEGGYTGPTVWNGSGTIRREAIVIDSGAVEATTMDQLRDGDVCPGEGISGTTTLVSDEHTVVITYDGATNCDEDDAARWSRDGEDQGTVTGVTCALAGGRTSSAAAIVLLVAAILVGWRRGERRAPRPGGPRR